MNIHSVLKWRVLKRPYRIESVIYGVGVEVMKI